jgi:hypothetical protein
MSRRTGKNPKHSRKNFSSRGKNNVQVAISFIIVTLGGQAAYKKA